VQTTGAALRSVANAIDGLSVDTVRMSRNLADTRGTIFAERAVILLTPALGREAAQALVARALERCGAGGTALPRALADLPEVASVLSADDLRDLEDPARYLGDAEILRTQLLAE
jgi:3-carboxy-cis,cis-muconate cycloisomerase